MRESSYGIIIFNPLKRKEFFFLKKKTSQQSEQVCPCITDFEQFDFATCSASDSKMKLLRIAPN